MERGEDGAESKGVRSLIGLVFFQFVIELIGIGSVIIKTNAY